jgi:hypothetical protein
MRRLHLPTTSLMAAAAVGCEILHGDSVIRSCRHAPA